MFEIITGFGEETCHKSGTMHATVCVGGRESEGRGECVCREGGISRTWTKRHMRTQILHRRAAEIHAHALIRRNADGLLAVRHVE